MTTVMLEPPATFLRCPSCGQVGQTERVDARAMHACPALSGLTAPLVKVKRPDDTPVERHLLIEREDYLGNSIGVGRFMATRTERPDGSFDCTAYAPTAIGSLRGADPNLSLGALGTIAEVRSQGAQRHQFHDEQLAEIADKLRDLDAEMAWTGTQGSHVFAAMMLATLTGQASHTMKLGASGDSFLVSLFGNTGTPDQTTTQALSYYNTGQWVTANEVYQAGQWAQGGVALGSPTAAQASGVVNVGAANTASGSAFTTPSNVYGVLVYDNTLTTKDGFCFNFLGGPNSVTSGTFTVVWAGGFLASITC
jgi:hypothetical protein